MTAAAHSRAGVLVSTFLDGDGALAGVGPVGVFLDGEGR